MRRGSLKKSVPPWGIAVQIKETGAMAKVIDNYSIQIRIAVIPQPRLVLNL
jgi:hypothetical protein